MSFIIPRNTKIPTKKNGTYYTSEDNQTLAGFEIFEGERSMTCDNQLLSKFRLNDIRLAPAGEVTMELTFEIDESGILTATAVETGTDNASKITVSIYKNNLSEEKISEMIETAKKFKAEDELKKDIAILKNTLSDKCIKFKKKVSNLLNVSIEDRKMVFKYCDEANDWMKSNYSCTNMSSYNAEIEEKIKEVTEKCTTIFEKYN